MIETPAGRGTARRTPRPAALLVGLALLAAPRAAMAQDESPLVADDSATAVQGFEHVLPPDTIAFLGTADVDAAGRNLSATAYGAWWHDADNAPLREALAALLSALGNEATAALGVDPLALPAMAHGRLAFALGGDLEAGVADSTSPCLVFTLLADVGPDHEACDAIVATLEEKLAADGHTARKMDVIDGTDVAVLEDEPTTGKPRERLRVAFHGETLIVLFESLPVQRDGMAFLLERLSGEPAACLADQPRFRDSLAAQPGDVQGWFDVSALVSFSKAAFAEEAAATAGEPAANGEPRRTPEETLDSVQRSGVFDLESLSLSASWSGRGSRVQVRLGWPGQGWVPSLARCLLAPGDIDLLASVPGTCSAAVAMRIDFTELFDQALRVGVQSGELPPSAPVDMLAKMQETLGFDLRDDLLDALDGRLGLMVFQVPPEDALPFGSPEMSINEVALVGLKDGAAINALIEDLVRRTSAHATRQRSEVLGYEVFHLPLLPGFAVHYAILPDMAIVSFSETLLLDALRRKAGESGQKLLGADSIFQARVAQLEMPAGLMHYGVASLGLLIAAGLAEDARSALVAHLSARESDDVARTLAQRLADVPSVDPGVLAKYFDGGMLTTLTMDERGLLFQSASP